MVGGDRFSPFTAARQAPSQTERRRDEARIGGRNQVVQPARSDVVARSFGCQSHRQFHRRFAGQLVVNLVERRVCRRGLPLSQQRITAVPGHCANRTDPLSPPGPSTSAALAYDSSSIMVRAKRSCNSLESGNCADPLVQHRGPPAQVGRAGDRQQIGRPGVVGPHLQIRKQLVAGRVEFLVHGQHIAVEVRALDRLRRDSCRPPLRATRLRVDRPFRRPTENANSDRAAWP